MDARRKQLYVIIALVIIPCLLLLGIGWSSAVEEQCHQITAIDKYAIYRIDTFSCEVLAKDGRWVSIDEYLDQMSEELDKAESQMKKYKERLEEIIRRREHIQKYDLKEI